ncbi:MAG TPA: cation transporter dimerization domain-containing protein [Roseiflexaceae bacterium]|nr:cation transporter dimerization domain-containing protein [Roseiflexaceae bacterium]
MKTTSIVVATIIAYNGIRLFWENLCFLLGRSPGADELAQLERLARSVPGVIGVHDLRAEYIGPDTVHAGMHIVVARGLPIEQAEQIAEQVRVRVHQGAEMGFCVIHVDAAELQQLPAAGQELLPRSFPPQYSGAQRRAPTDKLQEV